MDNLNVKLEEIAEAEERFDEKFERMKALGDLERALDRAAWEDMLNDQPSIAKAIKNAVESGATALDVRNLVTKWTGRQELALRCAQAAGYWEENHE